MLVLILEYVILEFQSSINKTIKICITILLIRVKVSKIL